MWNMSCSLELSCKCSGSSSISSRCFIPPWCSRSVKNELENVQKKAGMEAISYTTWDDTFGKGTQVWAAISRHTKRWSHEVLRTWRSALSSSVGMLQMGNQRRSETILRLHFLDFEGCIIGLYGSNCKSAAQSNLPFVMRRVDVNQT